VYLHISSHLTDRPNCLFSHFRACPVSLPHPHFPFYHYLQNMVYI
jgi:hypothetical protein